MGELIVVECDYGNGECLEKFSGFEVTSGPSKRVAILLDNGWSFGENGECFCPKHTPNPLPRKEV